MRKWIVIAALALGLGGAWWALTCPVSARGRWPRGGSVLGLGTCLGGGGGELAQLLAQLVGLVPLPRPAGDVELAHHAPLVHAVRALLLHRLAEARHGRRDADDERLAVDARVEEPLRERQLGGGRVARLVGKQQGVRRSREPVHARALVESSGAR